MVKIKLIDILKKKKNHFIAFFLIKFKQFYSIYKSQKKTFIAKYK